ncbi:MAG TPA: two-component regulator propeller domain-containing protein, partial [Kofleriaceae bacterium]|nr:two-component regulator propeller domain-containing protein [Kofleriaceae bacterium]
MPWRCAIAMSWLVALSQPARAHEPSLPDELPRGQRTFRLFGAADGLRNLVIASMTQDASGFLWLGTEDGVYRFDGERFTRFSDEAYVVGVGPEGNACLGYRTGLRCWTGTGFSRASTGGMPEISVRAMATFSGRLWVGSETGLYVGGPSGGFAPAPGWQSTGAVGALWADPAGLVVGDGATLRLSAGDGVWQTLGDLGVGSERIDGVLRDREGALWIRTARCMWLLPRGAARAVDISDGLPTHFDLVGAPSGMALGPRGTVLVGTDMGVAYRDGDHWRLIDRSVGMPAAATRSVLVDREGTVWIGAAGLFQMRGRGIVEHYNAASGLPGDIVWTFQRDPHGTLWLGTNRCLVRAAAGRWQCLPGTEGRTVRSLLFPPQGGMFVGGAPSDLLYIDDAGHITSFGHHAWPAEAAILSLGLGPNGDLWIATKAGLYRLPGAQPGPFEHVAIPGVRPAARFASVIAVGDQIWTATDEGLLVLDRGTWHRFDASAGFPSSVMRRVAARADGRICVTYNAAIGFSCLRYRDGHVSDVEHIGPAQGLTAGMVYFLGEDRQRRFWIGTGDGVDVLTPRGLDHFDENAGLAGNDSSATAFFIDDDGSLWLGATGGATHVIAQDYAGPPEPPRTAFLGGRLGDQPIAGRATLDTPHDRNALTLEFAASSLLDTRRVEYAVRLSPTESEWSVTHQRQARYPALLPGTYRFEVRARIGAGSWGPATELPFTVQSAWWQTRWFLVGIAVLLAAAIMWRQRFVLVRRTQQLHARSDASFRAVIDLMPDLISVYRDRRLIYLNVAIRRFLGVDGPGDGWDPLELIDSIHRDDRRRAGELFRRLDALVAGDSAEVIELRLRGADGSWRTCEVSAIQVDIGGALTIVASGRDVTERKRMHAKLLVSDRMASLGTLAAGIAHEINNPLAYVAGNLEAMAESLSHAKGAARAADCDELSAVVADARDGAERV